MYLVCRAEKLFLWSHLFFPAVSRSFFNWLVLNKLVEQGGKNYITSFCCQKGVQEITWHVPVVDTQLRQTGRQTDRRVSGCSAYLYRFWLILKNLILDSFSHNIGSTRAASSILRLLGKSFSVIVAWLLFCWIILTMNGKPPIHFESST